MDSSDEKSVNCTSPEISKAAKDAELSLLPSKSEKIYDKVYEEFVRWCNGKNVKNKNYTESVLLAYFLEKSKYCKPSTMWSYYSMLKATLPFLNRKSDGYKPKKSKIVSREEIELFLREAPDDLYLMMTRRPGASGAGYIYESRVAALMAAKLSFESNVKDFKIYNNVENYGQFDDIIVIVQYEDDSISAYAIQCKHWESKSISFSDFENIDANFNLATLKNDADQAIRQMKKDFPDIDFNKFYFIIFTNAKFNQAREINLTVNDFDEQLELPNTSKNTKVIQFSNRQNSEMYDANFLSQLFLFTSQSKVDEITKSINSYINNETTQIDDVGAKLFEYFSANWRENKNVVELDKLTMQSKLLEWLLLVVSPFEDFERSFDTGLLNKILVQFNITAITCDFVSSVMYSTKKTLESITGINMDYVNKANMLDQNQLNIIYDRSSNDKKKLANELQKHTFPSSQLSFEDLYLCAWKCRLIPIIINCSIIGSKTLSRFNKILKCLSVVLVDFHSEFDANDLSIFQDITSIEIKDKDTYVKLLDTFSVSFQGKEEIFLNQFKENDKVLKEITPDVCIYLLHRRLEISNEITTGPFYVERNLFFRECDIDLYKNSNLHEETIVLTNTGKCYEDLTDFNDSNANRFQYTNEKFNTKISADVDKLYATTKKSIHVFERSSEQRNFNWVYSKGTTAEWKHFVDVEKLSELALERHHTKINIISGTAGMGKTCLLKNLAKRYGRENFVSFINATQFISAEANVTNTETLWNFFISQLGIDKHLRKFTKQIIFHYNEKMQFICIIDDVHTLPHNVITLLKQILQVFVKGTIWLSTNSNFQKYCEEIFNTMCFEIAPLTAYESKSFLKNCSSEINNTSKIASDCQMFLEFLKYFNPSYSGCPFVIKMFAELLSNNNIDHNVTVDQLHDLFIKLEIKKVYSTEPDTNANYLILKLPEIAMTKFFTQEYLQSLGLEDVYEAIDAISKNYKNNNIITDIDNKTVTFGHSSFAEFLAAKLIAKNIIEGNKEWKKVFPKLFCKELTPVRKFFDYIISDQSPLHIAVLRNDMHNVLEVLKQHKTTSLKPDKLGRTALHLAASYGSFCNFYKSEPVGVLQINNTQNLQDVPLLSDLKEQISFQILEMLSRFKLKNNKDSILKYDVYEYALRSCSLRNLDFIYTQYGNREISLWDETDEKIFIYNIVKYNFHNILSTRKNFKIQKMKNSRKVLKEFRQYFRENKTHLRDEYNGNNLAEVAAAAGNVEVLKILLLSGTIDFNENNLMDCAFGSRTKEVIQKISELNAQKSEDSSVRGLLSRMKAF